MNININAENVAVAQSNIHVRQHEFQFPNVWYYLILTRERDNTRPCGTSRVNSLWFSDAIWRHKFWSTLVQVMACCLHQAIFETSVDLSSTRSSIIHSRVIFTWILKMPITKLWLKLKHLQSHPHLPGDNHLYLIRVTSNRVAIEIHRANIVKQ